jgi:hypothetical protein
MLAKIAVASRIIGQYVKLPSREERDDKEQCI